jgi:hypothetical protein
MFCSGVVFFYFFRKMSAVVTSYVIVKGSIHGSDCTVFGLEPIDEEQLLAQYQSGGNVMNGKIVKGRIQEFIWVPI